MRPLSDPEPTDACAEHPERVRASGEALRAVLRHVASPVVVVTVPAPDGVRGATIGSFTSVSLDPPLVSFNVTHGTRLHAALHATERLTVHLLSSHQADLAAHFAIPDLEGEEQLAPVPHTQTTDGRLRLDGVIATLDCETAGTVEAGDHTLVVATVQTIEPGRGTEPLLYYGQSYRGVGRVVEG